jgi:hypothetical protein
MAAQGRACDHSIREDWAGVARGGANADSCSAAAPWISGTPTGSLLSNPGTRIWGARQALQNGTPSSTGAPHLGQGCSTGVQGTAARRAEARKVRPEQRRRPALGLCRRVLPAVLRASCPQSVRGAKRPAWVKNTGRCKSAARHSLATARSCPCRRRGFARRPARSRCLCLCPAARWRQGAGCPWCPLSTQSWSRCRAHR